MDNTGLREVAESIKIGDKVTLGCLDFEFVVYDMVEDPNMDCLNFFGKKENYPEDDLDTGAEFVVDGPDHGTAVLVRVYDDELHGNHIDEQKYDTLEEISIVE